ncbi:MAG: manganese transport system substrate-binding protein [Actinomycetota bacterium]|nr:manganese transport system substrate-binding protein [Actinomycetota bacterium]
MRLGIVAVVALTALVACGGGGGSSHTAKAKARAGKKLTIATTVSPITSIVQSIAGTRAVVRGIVPEGTNSHTFEPKPSVAELLSTADVVFLNGLHLDDPTKKLAQQNARTGVPIVELGTMVLPDKDWIYDFSFPKADGKPNPHLWTDPAYALKYAVVVRDTLTKLDAAGAVDYKAGYDAFAKQVVQLDDAMRASFATIAAKQRKLLTYHDAYAYFAKDYGFAVIGAIQLSDFEEPTPKEVAALIDQIKAVGVPAIFGSEVFPSPVLKQIGRETGVRYVDSLRDDDLPGKPSDADHSWEGLLRFDYSTMTKALGGSAAALDALVVPKATGAAEYPQ